ncbi:MAG TPA: sigma 54-interacting transcriptional regulator [Candidatus Dormibacteraeota bacterium]|nr:sigma 54-interacting transcriptional regulator [Candidatus Dormibacteraeota bacterium]
MGKSSPSVGSWDGNNGLDAPADGVSTLIEGVSLSMRPVEAVIRELAQSDVPVLLLAERGAGKYVTARRIHDLSRRNSQPFRGFECSNLRPHELESACGETHAGTIFLRELSDLNAECQAYLQSALSHDAGNGRDPVTARFICGSARDLEVEVKTRRLREDLYYRISGVCLRLPPLRQRKEDIPVLMEHFLAKYAREFRRPIPALSPETRRLFQDYSWPGNLRELADAARVLAALGDEQLAMGGLRALLHKKSAEKPAAGNGRATSLKAASRAASQEAEKELILSALTRTRWNRRRAAEELQISYKALLYKLKQIGCERYGAS